MLLDARQLRCNLAYTLSPSLGAQAHGLGPSPSSLGVPEFEFYPPLITYRLTSETVLRALQLALYGEMLLRNLSSAFPDTRIGCTTIAKYPDSPRGREGGRQSRTTSSSMCVALLCCYHASTSVLILMYSPRQGAATERRTY